LSRSIGQNADRGAGFAEEEIAEGETLLGWFDPLELPTSWKGDAINIRDALQSRKRANRAKGDSANLRSIGA
jgi:hypothetical protein